ncbi:MAG: NAD(P)/FAD-dependent oxidoreductase [Paracoccaceae bacterium]
MGQIIVIGAGQAGVSLSARLRRLGYEGGLTLIGAEPVPPYQRPPLSKKYLLGEMAAKRLYLRPESFFAEEGIDLVLGHAAGAFDPVARNVTVGTKTYRYSQLALTTGSVPRRLPAAIGGDLGGVHCVRTLGDIDAMAPEFRSGRRVLIVGGGYIGLEAAAVASQRGLGVTLIEAAERILQRVAAPQTSDFFRRLHRVHGVDIREGVALVRLVGGGRVKEAELSDGSRIETDFVIVGVGISPQTALAQAAGLEIENGIRTDAFGRTSNAKIWAAGDCTSFPWRGRRIRLESVPNAIDQAEAVAANMLGANTEYVAKPWFWSDQYDVKLQIAGLNSGYDSVIERSAGGGTSFWYFRGRELLAVDAMNDPRAYMIGKRLIEAGRSPLKAAVADQARDLKSLLG